MQKLEPQISELLRTCVHPPSLLLRVAHVEHLQIQHDHHDAESTSKDITIPAKPRHGYATRYFLSDGHLMIQGLLHRKLSTLKGAAHVQVGDLLDIRRFTVKKSPRTTGQGKVVHLAIEDCTFLLQPDSDAPSVEHVTSIGVKVRKRKRAGSEDGRDEDPDVKSSVVASAQVLDMRSTPPSNAQPVNNLPQEHAKQEAGPAPGSSFDLDGAFEDDFEVSQDELSQTVLQQDNRHRERNKQKQQYQKSQIRDHDVAQNSASSKTFGARHVLSNDEDDEDDFFESTHIDTVTVKKRREALHSIHLAKIEAVTAGNDEIDRKVSTGSEGTEIPCNASRPEQNLSSVHTTEEAKALTRPDPVTTSKRDGTFALSQTPAHILHPAAAVRSHDQQPQPIQPQTQDSMLPAPAFHTLRSLRNPPSTQPLPTKNYILTTLAIISWTGGTLLHRPGSPFPPKRHLKIIDPSLTSSRPPSREDQARPLSRASANPSRPGSSSSLAAFKPESTFQDAVTVAVFIDAANFKPNSGTIALFRGLVMQRLPNGDVILNAYGRLAGQRFTAPENAIQPLADHFGPETRDSNSHWFITDHDHIRALGYGGKLDYYNEWWRERRGGQQMLST